MQNGLISRYGDCYCCCLRLRLILIFCIICILFMYLRRLSVELVPTVFTLQRCTDNIGYPFSKGQLKGLSVQYHVGDLKVSHKEHAVLEDFLKDLKDEFGQEDELTENKGLVHEYLGITIDSSIPRKVVFTMFDYLKDVIVEASKDLKISCSYYPGNDSLMKVDKYSPRLPTKDADLFHGHVARLLFASKRARPDMQDCVAFLYTRVKVPTEQGYKNY